MRRRRIIPLILPLLVSVLFSGIGVSRSRQSAAEYLEKALFLEEVEGDLNKAVEIYEHILRQFPENREIAAQAQLRIGFCFEKAGRKRARQAFQKVVENYPDQIETVALARKRLAGYDEARPSPRGGNDNLNVRMMLSGRELFYDGWLGGVSPDGRYASIVDWKTGDLAIRNLSDGTKRRLTDQAVEKGFPIFSTWSKDGTRIAFDWWRGDSFVDLRTIGIDEKKPRTVYKDDRIAGVWPMDWFPDGRRLLAVVWGTDMRLSGRLVVLDLNEGSAQELPLWVEDRAFVAPDGRRIAYNKNQEKGHFGRDIHVYSLEDEREWPLVEHPADDEILGWSPNGRWILFLSGRLGSQDAWVVAVSEGKARDEPRLVKRGVNGISTLGFDRDGAFYYVSSKKMEDIYQASIHPDTGEILTRPEKLDLPSEGSNAFPAYSPDGENLAYLRSRARSQITSSTLHIRSLSTGREKAFPLGLKARFPCWSPDGAAILLTGLKEGRAESIYRFDVESGDLEPVAAPGPKARSGYRYNEWAPDGKSFYSVEGRVDSPADIVRFDMETREKRVVHHVDFMISLSLSPDGRWIAFMGRGDERALTILPADGGEPRVICRFRQTLYAPIHLAWSPDGRYILFFHKKPDTPESDLLQETLFRVPVEGGEKEELDITVVSPGYGMTVHPSGRDIMFSCLGFSVSYPEYWVMENFLPRK